MARPRIVYVIDDEEAVRNSLAFLLEARALRAQAFPSAGEFLAAVPSLTPGCVLTDMRMPGMDGLDLLRQIKLRNLPWPVVVMTAYGEIPLAIRALRAGASDVIEKPFPGDVLIDAVLSALQTISQTRKHGADTAEISRRLATLTPREHDVLQQLVAGNQNKMIAHNLGMSPRTVEIHRARVLDKMQARSLSALVRMTVTAGMYPAA